MVTLGNIFSYVGYYIITYMKRRNLLITNLLMGRNLSLVIFFNERPSVH